MTRLSNGSRANTGRTSSDYQELHHRAAVLFIKHGLTQKEICRQINVSEPTLQKWRTAGRWEEIRPDLEIIQQYRAGALFLNEGLTTGEIAMRLNIEESRIKLWALVFGWDAYKKIIEATDQAPEIILGFCETLYTFLPGERTTIEFAIKTHLKSLGPITKII